MAYYVITENGIVKGLTVKAIEKKLDAKFSKTDFTQVNKDFVLQLTGYTEYTNPETQEIVRINDLMYAQDLKEMEKVSLGRLFRPKPFDTATILAILNMVLIIATFLRAGGGS